MNIHSTLWYFHVLESLKLDRDTIKLTVNFVLAK